MSIQLGLIDSCRFMTSGLDKLASNLNDISFDWYTLRSYFKQLKESYKGEDAFKFMRRKGLNPYEEIDSWEKFKKTRLPANNSFCSGLKTRI